MSKGYYFYRWINQFHDREYLLWVLVTLMVALPLPGRISKVTRVVIRLLVITAAIAISIVR